MTVYYYEMADREDMYYVSVAHGTWVSMADANRLNNQSLRIWCEIYPGRVTYNKLSSQWVSDMGQVDLKEFMWVKLRAQPYRKTLP